MPTKKHDWPFDFPTHAKTDPKSDLNAQDIYELIIRAVAVGNQESNQASRIGTGGGRQSADAVMASLKSRSTDILQG